MISDRHTIQPERLIGRVLGLAVFGGRWVYQNISRLCVLLSASARRVSSYPDHPPLLLGIAANLFDYGSFDRGNCREKWPRIGLDAHDELPNIVNLAAIEGQ